MFKKIKNIIFLVIALMCVISFSSCNNTKVEEGTDATIETTEEPIEETEIVSGIEPLGYHDFTVKGKNTYLNRRTAENNILSQYSNEWSWWWVSYVEDDEIETNRGIKVGDTLRTVVSKYGNAEVYEVKKGSSPIYDNWGERSGYIDKGYNAIEDGDSYIQYRYMNPTTWNEQFICFFLDKRKKVKCILFHKDLERVERAEFTYEDVILSGPTPYSNYLNGNAAISTNGKGELSYLSDYTEDPNITTKRGIGVGKDYTDVINFYGDTSIGRVILNENGEFAQFKNVLNTIKPDYCNINEGDFVMRYFVGKPVNNRVGVVPPCFYINFIFNSAKKVKAILIYNAYV